MIALLTDNRESIAGICPQLGVPRLDVFGSAASNDVDFVVDPGDYGTGVSHRYLGLIVALESLLDRHGNVVTLHGGHQSVVSQRS